MLLCVCPCLVVPVIGRTESGCLWQPEGRLVRPQSTALVGLVRHWQGSNRQRDASTLETERGACQTVRLCMRFAGVEVSDCNGALAHPGGLRGCGGQYGLLSREAGSCSDLLPEVAVRIGTSGALSVFGPCQCGKAERTEKQRAFWQSGRSVVVLTCRE